jgi:F0F1-type ATP synthase gamma subunit
VILDFSPDLKNSLDYKTSKKFSKSLLALYTTGAYRKIIVISTYYISAIRQIPTTKTLYPLSLEEIQLYFEKI